MDNETIVSKYKKDHVLGNGTFGTVFLVKLNETPYVLKEISMNSFTPTEKQRAFNEVSILAKLKHRNIIKYKESTLDYINEKLSIIMDYADSGDLASAIAKQKGVPFSVEKTISWFIQISLALQYIHAKNILHRDLKTQNIFLSGDNTIKIGDFGVSRLMKNSDDFAETRIGTPYYLSPEIYLGKLYNSKSDMWALGCVLFEISTLERPFKAETLPQLMRVILKGKRKPFPSWLKSGLLKQLVEDLLHFNPDQRPSTEEILAFPSLKTYVPFYAQDTKEISTGNITRETYRYSADCLKRSVSVLNSDDLQLNNPRRKHTVSLEYEQKCSSSTRTVHPTITVTEYIDKFEPNKKKPRSMSTQTVPPALIVTEYKDKIETNEKKPHSASTCTIPQVIIPKIKAPDRFENKQKQHFVFSKITPLANVTENKTPGKLPNSKPDIPSRSIINITYSVEKKNNLVSNSKPYDLCPTLSAYDIDCGYSSEEISRSADSNDNIIFEDSINDKELKLSIQIHEEKIAHNISSNQSHCGHSQCHQCMIDMMWKNRIRGFYGISRSNGDYLKLKKKLILIYGYKLFQDIYESLLQEWERNESSHTETSIQNFAKFLSYEQVQHLPLMMQLIQLDLVKISKNETYKLVINSKLTTYL